MNLILPCKICNKPHDGKCSRKDLPKFRPQIFECHYISDVIKFKTLLDEKNAIYINSLECSFLNKWNEPNHRKFLIIYEYFENIECDVLT